MTDKEFLNKKIGVAQDLDCTAALEVLEDFGADSCRYHAIMSVQTGACGMAMGYTECTPICKKIYSIFKQTDGKLTIFTYTGKNNKEAAEVMVRLIAQFK